MFLLQFTFAKIWLLYAQFEIRQKNLQGARKVMVSFKTLIYIQINTEQTKQGVKLKIFIDSQDTFVQMNSVGLRFSPQGTAIGKCPKNKLLKGYIELELQLREFDRCRKLYEKYLEFSPENCTTWIKFAELETILGDMERARGIFELAIGQPRLDMPEVSMTD